MKARKQRDTRITLCCDLESTHPAVCMEQGHGYSLSGLASAAACRKSFNCCSDLSSLCSAWNSWTHKNSHRYRHCQEIRALFSYGIIFLFSALMCQFSVYKISRNNESENKKKTLTCVSQPEAAVVDVFDTNETVRQLFAMLYRIFLLLYTSYVKC